MSSQLADTDIAAGRCRQRGVGIGGIDPGVAIEVEQPASPGRAQGAAAPGDVFVGLENDIGCKMLSLTMAPWFCGVPMQHSDPFDALLAAKAQAEGLRLRAQDRAMQGHPWVVAA